MGQSEKGAGCGSARMAVSFHLTQVISCGRERNEAPEREEEL